MNSMRRKRPKVGVLYILPKQYCSAKTKLLILLWLLLISLVERKTIIINFSFSVQYYDWHGWLKIFPLYYVQNNGTTHVSKQRTSMFSYRWNISYLSFPMKLWASQGVAITSLSNHWQLVKPHFQKKSVYAFKPLKYTSVFIVWFQPWSLYLVPLALFL